MKDQEKRHPATNETIKEACKRLNIDMRRKPFFLNGDIVTNAKYTSVCTGCDGFGCRECGGCGKRVSYYPELLASLSYDG